MSSWLVCHTLLPALPDDVHPGTREDPAGMRVGLVAGPGVVIHLRRPGIRVTAVLGEVDERVAELLVAGEPERHPAVLARLAGGRRSAGKTGKRLRRRKPLANVADLREQGRCPNLAGSRQAREDLAVRMTFELLSDPVLELADLATDREDGPESTRSNQVSFRPR